MLLSRARQWRLYPRAELPPQYHAFPSSSIEFVLSSIGCAPSRRFSREEARGGVTGKAPFRRGNRGGVPISARFKRAQSGSDSRMDFPFREFYSIGTPLFPIESRLGKFHSGLHPGRLASFTTSPFTSSPRTLE